MNNSIKILSIIVLILSIAWNYYSPGFEPAITAIASLVTFLGLFFLGRKSDVPILDIVLTIERPKSEIDKHWDKLIFSFYREEFIHPKVIEDLQGLISDNGEQIVSINLIDSQGSNRYFNEFKTKETGSQCPFVYYEIENSSFGYQYIASTESGIHILSTSEWGGEAVFSCA